jgi:polyhydroxyalkanoate synthesis regulator phasin
MVTLIYPREIKKTNPKSGRRSRQYPKQKNKRNIKKIKRHAKKPERQAKTNEKHKRKMRGTFNDDGIFRRRSYQKFKGKFAQIF